MQSSCEWRVGFGSTTAAMMAEEWACNAGADSRDRAEAVSAVSVGQQSGKVRTCLSEPFHLGLEFFAVFCACVNHLPELVVPGGGEGPAEWKRCAAKNTFEFIRWSKVPCFFLKRKAHAQAVRAMLSSNIGGHCPSILGRIWRPRRVPGEAVKLCHKGSQNKKGPFCESMCGEHRPHVTTYASLASRFESSVAGNPASTLSTAEQAFITSAYKRWGEARRGGVRGGGQHADQHSGSAQRQARNEVHATSMLYLDRRLPTPPPLPRHT